MEGEDERGEVVVVVLAARIAGEVESFDLLAEVGLRRAPGGVAFGHRVCRCRGRRRRRRSW